MKNKTNGILYFLIFNTFCIKALRDLNIDLIKTSSINKSFMRTLITSGFVRLRSLNLFMTTRNKSEDDLVFENFFKKWNVKATDSDNYFF